MQAAINRAAHAKVALVTGANTGIGLATARELAAKGMQVFIACRTPSKAQAALDQIISATGNKNVSTLALDLGDFASIRACAKTFLDLRLPLHLLINNAGLASSRGLTSSGFEVAFGTNHLGHFLLTQLLLDRIKTSAPARIVTLASRAHYRSANFDWEALRQPTKTRTGIAEYSVSKLANVLFSAELSRRLEGTGVKTYSLHPGVVASDIWRRVPWPFSVLIKSRMITTEEGALTSLHCATSTEAATETGLYYDQCKPRKPSDLGQHQELAAELWRRSEVWVS